MVLDPDGVPLDLGRTRRLVPPHLRRAVERRDRHCGVLGCALCRLSPRPTGATSTIRPRPGARGELASRGEGVVLLHTKVHHGFRVERPPDGRWRTYRPDGTQIRIEAPLRV